MTKMHTGSKSLKQIKEEDIKRTESIGNGKLFPTKETRHFCREAKEESKVLSKASLQKICKIM